MDSQLTSPDLTQQGVADLPAGDQSYQISERPVVARASMEPEASLALQLPRSYGTETLSLLARDPHTIFAFWDIDWDAAFHNLKARPTTVYLRLLNAKGQEDSVVEIEPMAGSCYVTVTQADTDYTGEIGYYHPADSWHCLATSHVVTTPPAAFSAPSDLDFATVPFHLSFQRMVDLLQATQEENANLTNMLADLRARVRLAEANSMVTPQQHELVREVEHVASVSPPSPASADPRLQKKLERIVSSGSSSPTRGFGGNSSR